MKGDSSSISKPASSCSLDTSRSAHGKLVSPALAQQMMVLMSGCSIRSNNNNTTHYPPFDLTPDPRLGPPSPRSHHVRIQTTFLRLQLLHGLRHALLPHRHGGQPRHPMPVRSARIVHTRAWQLSTVYPLITRPAVCLVEVTRPSTTGGGARGNTVRSRARRTGIDAIKRQGLRVQARRPGAPWIRTCLPTTGISRQLSTLSLFLLAP